jgi:hypothetical protein
MAGESKRLDGAKAHPQEFVARKSVISFQRRASTARTGQERESKVGAEAYRAP